MTGCDQCAEALNKTAAIEQRIKQPLLKQENNVSVKSLTLKWKGTNTCASAPRFFWALILKANLLAISNFSAFPADGVGAFDVPGVPMSFTLFFELNMLSICSSIYRK